MKNLLERLDTTKKKVGAIAMSSALLLTLGTGLTYAASADQAPTNPTQAESEGCMPTLEGNKKGAKVEENKKDFQSEQSTFIQRTVDGVTQYSVDGGKTWTQSLEGVKSTTKGGKTVTSYTKKQAKNGGEQEEKSLNTKGVNSDKGFDCIEKDDGEKSPLPPKPEL